MGRPSRTDGVPGGASEDLPDRIGRWQAWIEATLRNAEKTDAREEVIEWLSREERIGCLSLVMFDVLEASVVYCTVMYCSEDIFPCAEYANIS